MSFSVDKGVEVIHLILICHLVLIRGGYTPHFDMSFSVEGKVIHLILICHLVLIRVGYTPLFDMSFSVDKGRLYTSFWYVI